jgi:hypothetical protein
MFNFPFSALVGEAVVRIWQIVLAVLISVLAMFAVTATAYAGGDITPYDGAGQSQQ